MSTERISLTVIRQVLGPFLIGVTIYAFLLGVCAVQYVTYFTASFKDNKILFYAVVWMAMIDVLLTVNAFAGLWHYVIEHFAEVDVLKGTIWNFDLTPLFSTLTAIPVQTFLTYRIWRFSNSRILCAFLAALILGAAVPAWIVSVQIARKSALTQRVAAVTTAYVWLSLSVTCDALLSAIMIFYLRRQKSAFKHTNRIISRYIQLSIQSALPVTLCAIVILVLATTSTQTNIHYPFALSLGRFYTITFLTTLNARLDIRETENTISVNSVDLQVINRRARQQEVAIEVTHTRETHIESEWPRLSNKSSTEVELKLPRV
ncbi:hypothetical protein BDZ89DRAFT_1025401 [Hymenopellis radicata]|nr:hypothetical protein BDZ89DRAFT_1025401 [Hymenopellis radicata]